MNRTEIKKLYEGGRSVDQIAEYTGIKQVYVRKALIEAGLKNNKDVRRLTPVIFDQAVDVYLKNKDMNVLMCSTETGVGDCALADELNRRGLIRHNTGKRNHISDQQKRAIYQRRNAGSTFAAIAAELGFSESATIYAYNDYSMRHHPTIGMDLKRTDAGKVYALHRAGWSNDDIAADCGIMAKTVKHVLRDYDRGVLDIPAGDWRDKAECF